MAKTLEEVSRDAAELEVSDQMKLARLLLDLTDTKPEDPEEVQGAWDAEIQNRMRDLETGAVEGIPIEEVKRRMQAHLVDEG